MEGTYIRFATQADLPFVLDAWTRQFQYQYPYKYQLDFVKHFQAKLARLVDASTCLVDVLDDDSNSIVSFLVYTYFQNNQVIHYAYTKEEARRQRHLTRLLEFSNPSALPIVFTHAPKNERIMKHFIASYIYDPTILAEG